MCPYRNKHEKRTTDCITMIGPHTNGGERQMMSAGKIHKQSSVFLLQTIRPPLKFTTFSFIKRYCD